MIDPRHIDYAAAAHAAREGSPLLVEVAGRFLGFGAAERTALAEGGIPGWLWLVGGLSVGLVVGARLHKRYGSRMPKVVTG